MRRQCASSELNCSRFGLIWMTDCRVELVKPGSERDFTSQIWHIIGREQEPLMISALKNRGSISGIGRRAASAALALAVALVPAVVATRSAQAQTFSVLHSFTGAEGGNPNAGLIRDASGNLYGTTPSGGAHGLGTVFKLATTGKETVLHSFAGYPTDGFGPFASLIRDASGNFYSTTFEGGAGLCGLRFLPVGCGAIFKLDPTGHE